MSGRVFRHPIEVPFADIDLAKVLYFPRLFHYSHLAMEAFFGQVVGRPYARVLDDGNTGFPTVHTEADYFRPIRYGETVVAETTVRRLGGASVDFRFRFRVDPEAESRAEIRSRVVCVAMDAFRSRPIPEDLRAVFAAFLESSDPGAKTP